ncbi:two-component system OmpR family sensor kinase [Arthrobacter sp. V1I9]|uniref:sensor histidine kinase n=1 Tax=Arthrobacter sp. V1I9 TaxID=3042275 RepID=UPI0027945B05|nr:HAMP domain-containing sensor histidine kinase [Arthrobacter sp. V1I9]MDQ0868336.1 two-component system OmpR family sensor kinase [Arthrobacter sp. V1I9]
MRPPIAMTDRVSAGMRASPLAQGWHGFRAELRTVRFRVLATVLAFLAAGLMVTGITTLILDLRTLNSRVNEELLLQSARLQNVAAQGAPGGGPYTSLDQLFTVFLQGDAPGRYESVMATVNGGNTFLPAGGQPTDLADPELLEAARAQHVENQTVFHDLPLEARTVRLAITSVSLGDGDGGPGGLLVAASEVGWQREQMIGSFGTFAIASLATLLLAGAVGFAVTGRLFVPIRRLRQATGSITFEDLSTRVLVPAGDDDVSQLATDFNRMLDRLEKGIADQRQFVDDASHELRTPLTIIGGHLQLLQAEDPKDVSETQVLLLEELDRMQSLVDELLMLARSGRPGFVRLEWIDADAFLQAAMDRIRVLADRRWKIESMPGGHVRADRNRLTQAIEQLAANAVQSTRRHDVISLGAAWTATAGGTAPHGPRDPSLAGFEIWVADTGCGISPADQERIFERFARADVSRGSEGSGLGLPIVKAIAEAHSGTLRVTSRVNEGSRFVLSLPGGTP